MRDKVSILADGIISKLRSSSNTAMSITNDHLIEMTYPTFKDIRINIIATKPNEIYVLGIRGRFPYQNKKSVVNLTWHLGITKNESKIETMIRFGLSGIWEIQKAISIAYKELAGSRFIVDVDIITGINIKIKKEMKVKNRNTLLYPGIEISTYEYPMPNMENTGIDLIGAVFEEAGLLIKQMNKITTCDGFIRLAKEANGREIEVNDVLSDEMIVEENIEQVNLGEKHVYYMVPITEDNIDPETTIITNDFMELSDHEKDRILCLLALSNR